MKKVIGVIWVLGFVAIGLSACSQKEAPVQDEVVTSVHLPAKNLVQNATPTTEGLLGSVQETATETVADMGDAVLFVQDTVAEIDDDAGNVTGLVEDTVADAITDAGEEFEVVQETVTATTPDGDVLVETVQEIVDATDEDAVVEGVASATQSSAQTAIREGDAVASGVVAAAQSSSQVAAREEGVIAEEVAQDAGEETVPEPIGAEQIPI